MNAETRVLWLGPYPGYSWSGGRSKDISGQASVRSWHLGNCSQLRHLLTDTSPLHLYSSGIIFSLAKKTRKLFLYFPSYFVELWITQLAAFGRKWAFWKDARQEILWICIVSTTICHYPVLKCVFPSKEFINYELSFTPSRDSSLIYFKGHCKRFLKGFF